MLQLYREILFCPCSWFYTKYVNPTMKEKNEFLFANVTRVILFHYIRLLYRSILFLALLFFYVNDRTTGCAAFSNLSETMPVIVWIFELVFLAEMLFRHFPSKLESPGCQKQFAVNYQKTNNQKIHIEDNHSTILVLVVWILFNMVFGVLKFSGVFDDGIMLLICSAYSICDIICILFFCPFQSWFLKNRCCSTCRIYNWDYAMMFTPLFFVGPCYLSMLPAFSLTLLARWEITFHRHPERYSKNTNGYLSCENCSEKLCAHKKQLRGLWKKLEINH